MNRPIRQVLADSVRHLMSCRPGTTITSLAKDVGISRGQMNNILTQKSATTIDTLEKIAAVFDTAPMLLLGYSPPFPSEGRYLTVNLPTLPAEEDATISGAVTFLVDAFATTDDEGKFALLRIAAAEYIGKPDTYGVKLPRDWRGLALSVMRQAGYELHDYTQKEADTN